jgi:hypothetical protein
VAHFAGERGTPALFFKSRGKPMIESRAFLDEQTIKKMTEDDKEHFEERAAILEFDAGYSRGEAEKEALRAVLERREKCRG